MKAAARKIKPPLAVALATALVGLMGVVSTLLPEVASRSRVVKAVLPPAGRCGADAQLACGLAFSGRPGARAPQAPRLAARGRARRRLRPHPPGQRPRPRRGGRLADRARAARARRRDFVAPGDPESVRPLLQIVLASRRSCRSSRSMPKGGRDLGAPRRRLLVLIGALAARGLFLWLRPIAERARHVPADRRRAAELVREPRHRQPRLLRAPARQVASSSRPRAAPSSPTVSSRGPRSSPATRSARSPSGAGARRGVPPRRPREGLAGRDRRGERRGAPRLRRARFPLDLPRRRGVRAPRALLARRPPDPQGAPVGEPALEVGLPGRVLQPDEVGERRATSSARSRSEWRGRWPERGFTMAMDALFAYPDTVLALAIGPEGGSSASSSSFRRRPAAGYSLAAMRRLPESPNGLMEFADRPRRSSGRATRRGARALAQLLGLRRVPARRRERAAALLLTADRALPARAAAQLQPQVLPRVAPAVLLLRALDGPARSRASRTCTPSRCSHPRAPGRRLARPRSALRRPRGARSCRRRGRGAAARQRAGRTGRTVLRLAAVRLRRGAQRRRAGSHRDHRRERRHARAAAGRARRHGRLLADLPPRRQRRRASRATPSS